MKLFHRAPRPTHAEEAFEWAEEALEDEDPDGAIELLDAIVHPGTYADASSWRVRAAALRVEAQLEQGEVAAAVKALGGLIASPEDTADGLAVGRAFYRAGRFERARELLDHAAGRDSSHPDAWEQLAKTLIWLGDNAGADEAFASALKADDEYAMPFRVTPAEFEAMAARALQSIPEPMLSMVADDNLIIVAPPLPERAEVEAGLNPDVLGYFHGPIGVQSNISQDVYGYDSVGSIKRIAVFQINHENNVTDRDELEDEVAKTVLHEVAHYFGMDHDDIDATRLR